MRVGKLFLIGGILILFIISACDISKPEPGFEGIPGPEFSIPDSLISTTGPGRVTRGDAQTVFEPFRAGLGFAQWSVDFVSLIIAGLNENQIPDSGEFVNNGELVVITTESDREYETIIEFYIGETAVPEDKYLQISYTKDINKGEAVLDVGIKYPAVEDVDRVKIYYDGTGNQPVLKGWLTFNYDIANEFVIYPVSLYFNANKNNNKVTIEGGLSYHYKFDESGISLDDTYVDEHVYMFKAIGDVDQDKAIVNLYFPQKDILLSEIDNWDIADSMLYILFEWINLTGNAALLSDLVTLNGGNSIDTPQELYDLLDLYREETSIADLIFILDLTNPIAYNGTIGYVANGADVSIDYSGIGNIDAISFSEEPIDIYNLEIVY